MKLSRVGACAMALCLAGCAAMPEQIGASYVSPLAYADYDCAQITAERERIATRVNQVAGAQAKQAQNEQIATGIGLVLFWPALFLLAGPDRKEELANLKGRYEALEQAGIEKRCGTRPPTPEKAKGPKTLV